MHSRLKQLLSEMESLGYVREEVMALCRLSGSKSHSPEQIEKAVAFLEYQVDFGKKCLEAIRQ